MQELNTDGLVEMTAEERAAMPCEPRAFHFHPWVFLNTFQRMEREEAAARILAYSQQCDQWVGVPWTKLIEMMQQDYALHDEAQEIQRQNDLERQRVMALRRNWWIKSILTCGRHARRVEKPEPKIITPPELPLSIIFVFGPQHVANGIHELLEQKLLELRQVGDEDIFFPTPALVARILEVQGQRQATA